MRYGLIRDAAFLPSPAEQRAILEAMSCDIIVHERSAGVEGARRITRLLFGLKRDDEILVQSLTALLGSTGEIARILRDLLEVGASVVVAEDADNMVRLAPSEDAIQALVLLADHENRRPSQPPSRPAGRIGGGSRKPLSPYQVNYARKLHQNGASLRSIGQLFQISPEEVWNIVAR